VLTAGDDRVAGVPDSPLSRRGLLRSVGVLAASGAALALGGCDLDPSSSPRAVAPRPNPDQKVVDAARAELSDLISRLSATSGAAALEACHRTQLRALGGQSPPVTRRSRPFSAAQAVARERRAATRFDGWARTCDDGDLARVLASVSAGIRMQPVLVEPT
jgi:hypothetical protein